MGLRLHWLASALAIVLLGGGLIAATQAPSAGRAVIIFGPADEPSVSCQMWREARDSGGAKAKVYEYWMLGYVSGASEWAVRRAHVEFAATSADDVLAWITTYCVDHPSDTMVKAGDELLDELERRAK